MTRFTRRDGLLAASGLLLAAATRPLPAATRRQRYWVGTYTNASGEIIPTDFGQRPASHVSRGLYTFEFDADSGVAGEPTLGAETTNPINLVMHDNGRVLYACRGQNSRVEGQSPITAFAIDGATLRELNTAPSGGTGPTVGVVDRSGRNLLTTNFSSHSIVCFRLRADGSLAERTAFIGPPYTPAPEGAARPAGAAAPAVRPGAPGEPVDPAAVAAGKTKPHAIVLAPGERYAIAAEIDGNRCTVLRFDAARGSLDVHAHVAAHEGGGPRHLVFGPGGRFLYTSNERDSTVSVWRWDGHRGELAEIQHLGTLPPGSTVADNHPADIQIDPSGRFVYVSNRTTGTLAGYRIDARTGLLTHIADAPIGALASWSLLFDPTGRWALVSAQTGDFVAVHRLDARTGELMPTGQRLDITLPTCLRRSA